ncbi:MAG TPA: pyridoxamine 5'-phosphate oxidase [Alphaproteobacteria bacterium]|jgi:pyridoxamine 5'-phosphate oxidase|uniref:pyridoxamine 5'-phosphate oxidase n=1 Tax=Sphingomonas pruni TaxID=40683 RepID=UPI000829BC86|nr:pyridoxamine 5'-phosphate oxidase [Sphingomonas pruni]HTJ63169.1 pyridoxamine 5'-phosphate oxidase [Alphaproteobacteria bacterium]
MTEPWPTLERWFADAAASDPVFYNAAALATADRDGRPSSRIVLLKRHDRHGVEFFTNRASRKARDLADRPDAAICLFWPRLGRQLRIEGPVTATSSERSDAYFASRDRDSQIGAWASRQSEPLPDGDTLVARIAAHAERFGGREVARPPFWGGYVMHPTVIEFWSDGVARLHERQECRRRDDEWTIQSLFP